MSSPVAPVVALFAHRFAEPYATGIAQAARELRTALDDALDDAGPLGVVSCSPPEPPAPGADRLRHIEHVSVPGPRKLRYAAWTALRRPPLDQVAGLGDVSLVHVQHPAVAVPTRVATTHTVHDLLPLLEPGWYARSERWLFRTAYADVAERTRRVLCISPFVAAQVVEVLGVPRERVQVVPLGIAGRFTAAPGATDVLDRLGLAAGRYVLHVGTVTRRKNLEVLVAALDELDPELVPALVLAGPDGLGADSVRREVERRGLADRVRLTGYVADADLPALVAGAGALAHPSLGEGQGLTPLEAMAARVPVVVSDAGALPWVVGDAGVIVDRPTDPSAWASALTGLLTDPDERRRLVTAGDRRAAEFSWRACADAHLAAWADVLGAT